MHEPEELTCIYCGGEGEGSPGTYQHVQALDDDEYHEFEPVEQPAPRYPRQESGDTGPRRPVTPPWASA